jgi:hypothetical protein
LGFDIMVNAGQANRTLIGKVLNRQITEGDFVHVGVGPKRDGLTACERASVVCVDSPDKVSEEQRYWFNFVEEAYRTGYEAYVRVAEQQLPAKQIEKTLGKYDRRVETLTKLPLNLQHLVGG